MLESNFGKPASEVSAAHPFVSYAIEKISGCEIQEFTDGSWLIIARGAKKTGKKSVGIKSAIMLKGSLTLTLNVASGTSLKVWKQSFPPSRGSSSKKIKDGNP